MQYVKRGPAGPKSLTNPNQGVLELSVDRQAEIDGIGMGVLNDGTPFLNQRGLARMCGVQNAHIGTISSEWHDDSKRRIASIKKILAARGLTISSPHIEVYHGGRKMFAYSDHVCLAVLEYYAFDAANIQEEAKERYRWLAGRSLRDVIYTQLGYRPNDPAADAWRQFHDRVSLVYDNVPAGYFCIFKEIADLMVTLINAGAKVGAAFLPDLSVGRAWSTYWQDHALYAQFSERQRYTHNFPNYFPQAVSNPQSPYCYPEVALGAFRKWMREVYLPHHLPSYLEKKVRDGALPSDASNLVIGAFKEKQAKSRLLPGN
ncbi:MAG: hypothetical protein JNN24_05815 [Hyphomicrobium zavarzinii]|uniref:hypothetical protein n=1 Tax=Hyphomicrobium zavarzinii TaxID=48292 RepID=UPI001A57336F|nr:hypothetical protein [Hyphomicrobium zavarzinii]MBL8845269.1 hypothetical protein [Hyphomicrobium zavarzinii]